ncbi:MAG: fused MFS/spermidine synthase [Lachnospiraceae bacterium]|nr:fused MFS/spermidine synthase [Lachnospiraceae bacterium]
MEKNILKSKLYLYLTEFISGMAVMAVEQGASRLLAPYFSSSQIVWTIIIGTIMIAMALGNIFGGRWADKDPDPAKLFRRIMLAAIWIAAIPLLGKYIIIGITGILIVTISTNLLIWAAFLACMIIFVFPLFLLGTVTPSLIRYTVSDLDESGSIAGGLGACNTVGSILGTFLPTFVTIPTAGTAATFLIFAGLLLVLSALYFIVNGGGRKTIAVSMIVFLICAAFGHSSDFAFWEKDLAFEGESIYNYLQVRDTPDATILSTNVMFGVQSIRKKNENLTGMYYDYALMAPVMAGLTESSTGDEKPSVLILGMGTGTFAAQCARYFPEAEVSGVEIDEKITDLAHKYFELPESVSVETYDGRAYLNADSKKYDVIMVDAYQDITIPFQMSSVEFFSMVRDHLKENGVMVVNLNMYDGDGETITSYLSDTIASVFADVSVVDVSGSTNRELFASNNAELRKGMAAAVEKVPDKELKAMLEMSSEELKEWHSTGNIFTDDRAPVELMGIKTIDGLINSEIQYYKDVFRKKGFSGLLNEI